MAVEAVFRQPVSPSGTLEQGNLQGFQNNLRPYLLPDPRQCWLFSNASDSAKSGTGKEQGICSNRSCAFCPILRPAED